jgi:hypothetical protein
LAEVGFSLEVVRINYCFWSGALKIGKRGRQALFNELPMFRDKELIWLAGTLYMNK